MGKFDKGAGVKMGAWNLTAGLILIVVFLNVQALEADPKGNSPDELQEKLFPKFQQILVRNGSEEELLLETAFNACAEKWLATIGDPCSAELITEWDLRRTYKDVEIPVSKVKKIIERRCHLNLICTGGKCECNGSSVVSSSCFNVAIPKKDLTQNCDTEFEDFFGALNFVVRSSSLNTPTPSSVSDPGQNFQYIFLMAVNVFVLAVQ